MVNYCCVFCCDNNSRDKPKMNFFSVPSDPSRQISWLPLIGRKEWMLVEPNVIARKRICSAHFSPAMISGSRLKKEAIPDIFEDGRGFRGTMNLFDFTTV
ncbi:hypothetical protein HHI36_021729 [Cryptolaemus montrouzieri]|uniref:THAP-type domain-containing protein n=1 Tax=Cryptolaemus montrouzieri TaxID=559131 RepID=A0ABD2MYF7_9CUCU